MRYAVIISVLLLSVSCTGRQANISAPDVEVDSAVSIEGEPVYNAAPSSVKNIEPVSNASRSSEIPEDRFNSSEEAYNEGYYNGDQEGYSDALNDFEYGYNYDNTPEYAGYAAYYAQGYEDGYEDGYQHGISRE